MSRRTAMAPKQSRWIVLEQLLCWLILCTILVLGNVTSPSAQDEEDSFQGYLERDPQRQASQAVVQKFIDAAIAKDVQTLKRLIGGPISGRVGPEAIERYLSEVVVPFFAKHNVVGRSTTISTAIDEDGS